MSFEIKQATRQGVKPLIGIFGSSGTGKTMTALLLARGLVGDKGKIVMLDTESGRGSLYADVIPGGYETIEFREPFSPARYIEAVQTAESKGANVLVIDSASHEWEGIGGVTEMAGNIAEAAAHKWNKDWDGSIQFGHWKTPKMEHQKFVLKLLQSPLAIIVCLRAKQKSKQVKGTQEMADGGLIEARMIGKTCVVKDRFASPIQAEDFIFEMMAYMEVMKDHSVCVIKHSHPSLRQCFPEDFKAPISIEHGKKLAAWCASAGSPVGVSGPAATVTPPKSSAGTSDDEMKALKRELWELLKPVRGAAKDWSGANDWLWAEDILDAAAEPIQKMPDISAAKMREVILKAKQKLGQLV